MGLAKVVMYTDGACRGNPGPGGWGVVWVEGGEPKKERPVPRSAFEDGQPVLAAARLRCDHRFRRAGVRPGREHEARGRRIDDEVELIPHRAAEVPLAGGRRVVARRAQLPRDRDGAGRERPVELLGAGLVGIQPGEDAGAARAADRDPPV